MLTVTLFNMIFWWWVSDGWGGISMERHADFYSPDAIGNRMKSLDLPDPYTGAVGLGFLLVHDSARPHVAKLRRQFLEDEGIDTNN